MKKFIPLLLLISLAAHSQVSLFSSDRKPANTTVINDATPLSVGVKITSDASGTFDAIKFYKAAGNTAAHVGAIYDSKGVLLTITTFAGETASGWQVQKLNTPVKVIASAQYTVVVYNASGFYSGDNSFFNTPYTNGVLHASVGVYAEKTIGIIYPTTSYLNSNYWVDVVFTFPAATIVTKHDTTNVWVPIYSDSNHCIINVGQAYDTSRYDIIIADKTVPNIIMFTTPMIKDTMFINPYRFILYNNRRFATQQFINGKWISQ